MKILVRMNFQHVGVACDKCLSKRSLWHESCCDRFPRGNLQHCSVKHLEIMDGRLLRVPQESSGSTDLRGRIVKKIEANGGEKCKTHASTQRQIARQSSFHTMIHVSVIEFQGRGFCADTTGQLEPYQAARICYRITSVHLGRLRMLTARDLAYASFDWCRPWLSKTPKSKKKTARCLYTNNIDKYIDIMYDAFTNRYTVYIL